MLAPYTVNAETRHQLIKEAHRFRTKRIWTLPRIISGHRVGNLHGESDTIGNFSTITQVVHVPGPPAASFFLVYRYPLSWVHSITDGIPKLMCGKRSIKPLRASTWKLRFRDRSRIQLVGLGLPDVICMPYIPNYSLHDMLAHGYGGRSGPEIIRIVEQAGELLNRLHQERIRWCEPIAHNIIVPDDRTKPPIFCDPENEYLTGTDPFWARASDWFDLIFSCAGSCQHDEIDSIELAEMLTSQINDSSAAWHLANMVEAGPTFMQRIFGQAFFGRLSCPRAKFKAIAEAVTDAL